MHPRVLAQMRVRPREAIDEAMAARMGELAPQMHEQRPRQLAIDARADQAARPGKGKEQEGVGVSVLARIGGHSSSRHRTDIRCARPAIAISRDKRGEAPCSTNSRASNQPSKVACEKT